MSTKKSYPVGSIVISCGLIYQVRQGDTCEGCAFWNDEEGCIEASNDEFTLGPCSAYYRCDDTHVIFHYIGEVK